MLSRAIIRDFRSLKDVELSFVQFNMLVGPNACGKTNVLNAIQSFVGRDHTQPNAYYTDLKSDGGCWFWVLEDVVLNFRTNDPVRWCVFGEALKLTPHDIWPMVALGRDVSVLKHQESKLKQPSYSAELMPTLALDGEGLASVLSFMRLNDPRTFERLVEDFKAVIPAVEEIRFGRAPIERQFVREIKVDGQVLRQPAVEQLVGEEILLDMSNAKSIPASQCSEGTMLVLGLLAAIYNQSAGPKLLLIDDLDRGLHPKAQGELISLLRRLLARFPQLQIIATAHSPYMVDCMEPDEVWCMALDDDRGTVARRLSDHPKLKDWIDEMSPGEFWSMVGESWVFDASPDVLSEV